jgi:hypothetical protein
MLKCDRRDPEAMQRLFRTLSLKAKRRGHGLDRPTDPHLIELRVDEPRQLFDTLDPFPFRERDIDSDAENYIVAWARELPTDAPWKIVVHLPDGEPQETLSRELNTGFERFFRYRADAATYDLRELFRLGRASLLVGLTVLIGSVFAAQQVSTIIESPSFARLVEESLLILGWVANWRPLEIFLYDWLPLVRRRKLYRRLAQAKVSLRATKANKAGDRGGQAAIDPPLVCAPSQVVVPEPPQM